MRYQKYDIKKDGSVQIEYGETTESPPPMRHHPIGALPGVVVGVRYEKDGDVVVPLSGVDEIGETI